jgi:chaperonin GroES
MERLKIDGNVDLNKIVVLGQRVLVKTFVSEKTNDVSFYMPESAKEKSVSGIVIKVGDTKVKEGNEIDIKVNDNIIFQKWGATEITINDTEYYIVKLEDLLLVYGRSN